MVTLCRRSTAVAQKNSRLQVKLELRFMQTPGRRHSSKRAAAAQVQLTWHLVTLDEKSFNLLSHRYAESHQKVEQWSSFRHCEDENFLIKPLNHKKNIIFSLMVASGLSWLGCAVLRLPAMTTICFSLFILMTLEMKNSLSSRVYAVSDAFGGAPHWINQALPKLRSLHVSHNVKKLFAFAQRKVTWIMDFLCCCSTQNAKLYKNRLLIDKTAMASG